MGHHGFGTMRPGTHRNTRFVENHPDIVRMRPLDRKRNDTALIGLGAVNAQPVDPLQPLGRINQQFVFVARHFVGIQRTEVTDRFAEADRTDIVRSPRLELERQFGVCSTRKTDRTDHVSPAHERRHLFQPFLLAVQHADSGRSVKFVSRKGIEIAIERLHIDPAVHNTLTTVHQHRHPGPVRQVDHRRQVGPRPQHVRRLRDADDPRPFVEQFRQFFGHQAPRIVERYDSQFSPFTLADQLPRNDVRVMFHFGGNHVVARMDILLAETVRHGIDRGGRPGRKNDLAHGCRTDQRAHLFPCRLVLRSALLAQVVQPAVDIGIQLTVQVVDLFDHLQRFLRRRTVIQISQLPAVYLAAQQRKIGPYFCNIVCHLFYLLAGITPIPIRTR